MTREFEYVTCPGCGRRIGAYVPHMGDGTGLRTPKHKNETGATCMASQKIITRENRRWLIDQ